MGIIDFKAVMIKNERAEIMQEKYILCGPGTNGTYVH